MTNAGYFNMKTGETGDFHVCEGVISPSVPRPTLRGTFGVDKDQKPAAVWASRDADKNTFFYDSPMMNIKGKTAYEEPYGDYPTTSVAWTPYYAMSAGPLLVKDGKVVTDVTKQDGAFVRNYESIAADIFTNTVGCKFVTEFIGQRRIDNDEIETRTAHKHIDNARYDNTYQSHNQNLTHRREVGLSGVAHESHCSKRASSDEECLGDYCRREREEYH